VHFPWAKVLAWVSDLRKREKRPRDGKRKGGHEGPPFRLELD
jgi:hypothetical protein